MVTNNSDFKLALVVEGGGMRGVFSAGVLHAFGNNQFDPFDLYIGVSAGACNLASHIAEQNDRNFYIYKNWSSTKKFISLFRFLRGGHLVDLDWLWDVTIGQYRLDLNTIFGKKNKTFVIVVTSMETGEARYLIPNHDTLEDYLKASSALPVVYRGKLTINNELVADGGIADSIPVKEAYRRGARKMVVIRSRPFGYVKRKTLSTNLLGWQFRDKPELVKTIQNRAENYMDSVAFMRSPPEGTTILEIAAPDSLSAKRLSTDVNALEKDFQIGIERGMEAIKQIKTMI